MPDIVVTVPKSRWPEWIQEGDLPGSEWSGYTSHFMFYGDMPDVAIGDRIYIVAHGRLRGYAPLFDHQTRCSLNPRAHCFMRRGGAQAITIPQRIVGFRGWRYRWWDRADEIRFPNWRTP